MTADAPLEFDRAVKQGNLRKIRALAAKGMKPPNGAILYALVCKRPELLPALHKAGANVNDCDAFRETALGHAVNYYDTEVVRLLLSYGADPNQESLYLLPIIHAIARSRLDHLKVLLVNGADPNRVQSNGLTPLLSAVRSGDPEAAKLLLAAGADPGVKVHVECVP